MAKPSFKVVKKNTPEGHYKDLYHNLLRISWLNLFFVYVLFFITINFIFAAFYIMVPGSITSTAHDFKTAFFFSVQTFSTVGYGTVAPGNLYGNLIVVFEIMTGVVSMAVTTGLVFAKFSKPSAKILYSKNLLLTKFDGEDVLMFRMANARSNQIISAKIEMHYIYQTMTKENKPIVRFAPLKLQKSYSPVFAFSWSVFHPIDSESPFYGKTLKEIQETNYEFYTIVSGNDGTFSQTIFDTHYYHVRDILENHIFLDILHRKEDGTRVIDYKKFHQTVAQDQLS